MPVEGMSRLTRLQLAKLAIDYTKPTVEIKTQCALIDSASGVASFLEVGGSVWSAETQAALRSFVALLEEDIGRLVFSESSGHEAAPRKTQTSGIAEHLSRQDGGVADA